MISCYFDDFSAVEVAALADNHSSTVKAGMDLCGVVWATDKDMPFAPQAETTVPANVRKKASDTKRPKT